MEDASRVCAAQVMRQRLSYRPTGHFRAPAAWENVQRVLRGRGAAAAQRSPRIARRPLPDRTVALRVRPMLASRVQRARTALAGTRPRQFVLARRAHTAPAAAQQTGSRVWLVRIVLADRRHRSRVAAQRPGLFAGLAARPTSEFLVLRGCTALADRRASRFATCNRVSTVLPAARRTQGSRAPRARTAVAAGRTLFFARLGATGT